MAKPKEKEEINEALSTEELKSVNGGVWSDSPFISALQGNGPEGKGCGMTLDDYNKRLGLDAGPINKKEVGPITRER